MALQLSVDLGQAGGDHRNEGRLKPHVSRTYPLTDFKDAMRAKWQGEVVGGCVLHP